MKKNYFIILLALMFAVCMSVQSQTFVHPGIPLSGSDLSTLKAHVQAGDYPWKQAYDLLAADGKSQLTYTMQVSDVVFYTESGIRNKGEGYFNSMGNYPNSI
jgi:hypothetical protein